MAAPVRERFEMGRTINRATGAIGRNPALFLGLAAVLDILPAVVLHVFGALDSGRAGDDVGQPTAVLALLLSWLTGVMLQAAVTRATIVDLQGEVPGFIDALRTAAGLFLPLIGLGIVYILGIMLGFLLLVIPGIVVAVMWSVSLPVLVDERSGIAAGLGRSRELTKGARWRISGLLLVATIAAFLPLMLTAGIESPPFAEIVKSILSGLASMLLSALIAATYIELRFVKDGIGAERLAAVFE